MTQILKIFHAFEHDMEYDYAVKTSEISAMTDENKREFISLLRRISKNVEATIKCTCPPDAVGHSYDCPAIGHPLYEAKTPHSKIVYACPKCGQTTTSNSRISAPKCEHHEGMGTTTYEMIEEKGE